MRRREEANAFRNDDSDGSRYFKKGLLLDSDLFRKIDPQEEVAEVPVKTLRVARKVHGNEGISVIKMATLQENESILTCSNDGYFKISTLSNC